MVSYTKVICLLLKKCYRNKITHNLPWTVFEENVFFCLLKQALPTYQQTHHKNELKEFDSLV